MIEMYKDSTSWLCKKWPYLIISLQAQHVRRKEAPICPPFAISHWGSSPRFCVWMNQPIVRWDILWFPKILVSPNHPSYSRILPRRPSILGYPHGYGIPHAIQPSSIEHTGRMLAAGGFYGLRRTAKEMCTADEVRRFFCRTEIGFRLVFFASPVPGQNLPAPKKCLWVVHSHNPQELGHQSTEFKKIGISISNLIQSVPYSSSIKGGSMGDPGWIVVSLSHGPSAKSSVSMVEVRPPQAAQGPLGEMRIRESWPAINQPWLGGFLPHFTTMTDDWGMVYLLANNHSTLNLQTIPWWSHWTRVETSEFNARFQRQPGVVFTY